jgi:hypothetical protein
VEFDPAGHGWSPVTRQGARNPARLSILEE